SGDAVKDYAVAVEAVTTAEPDFYLEQRDAQSAAGVSWQPQLASLELGLRRLGPVPSLEDAALDIELRAKAWDGALGRLERQASGAARQERWHYRRGLILAQAGRKEQAIAAFRASMDAIDKLPPALRNHRATLSLAEEVPRELQKLGVAPN